jgi:hypothetical protein
MAGASSAKLWLREIGVLLGAALGGSFVGTVFVNTIPRPNWSSEGWSIAFGFALMTLLWTIPGSMSLALVFIAVRRRFVSMTLAYLTVLLAGGGLGYLMLAAMGGNSGPIGGLYGVLTASAWVGLHALTEPKGSRAPAEPHRSST